MCEGPAFRVRYFRQARFMARVLCRRLTRVRRRRESEESLMKKCIIEERIKCRTRMPATIQRAAVAITSTMPSMFHVF